MLGKEFLEQTKRVGVVWKEAEIYQKGSAFDFGTFTKECVQRLVLDGERVEVVLMRVDWSEGSYFVVEYPLAVPRDGWSDARLEGIWKVEREETRLARINIEPVTSRAICEEEFRQTQMYNGLELALAFGWEMRKSLRMRKVGVKPDGAVRIG